MRLATIRVENTIIVSLGCSRLDEEAGKAVLEIVGSCIEDGAHEVVLDFAPDTVVDFAGARALERASEMLEGGCLRVAGLNGRARALLRSVRVAERVRLVEWWYDGGAAQAA